MAKFHSFLCLSSSPLRMCVVCIFFIYLSVSGHLGCFLILGIINNAVMHYVFVFFELVFLFSSDICPAVDLWNHMVLLFLVFLMTLLTLFFFFFFLSFSFFFFRASPVAYGSSQARVESEFQLPTYTTATAMWDPCRVCNLHHSSWQCWIPNPLSEARDQTHVLKETMLGFSPTEPQRELLLWSFW